MSICSPAKYAALNVVVANCEMPPPISLTCSPLLMAPAGTPGTIVARLTQELEAASKDEAVRERLKATFVQIEFAGPQEFSRRLDAETALYGEIIRAAKIKLGQ